jgi:NADPH:quinone reductase-like Zn-dependent oxidoreductase
MMALRAHHRGSAEALVYEQAPRPAPTAEEVLVAVRAAAITYAELSWPETWTSSDGVDRTPIILAHEVSGTIVQKGPSVAQLDVDDDVYGLIPFDRDGAAAEYVAVPSDAVARKPRTISHTEAAALPLGTLTAWQALVDHADVHKGDHVLVHGGAGGVGVYAVQLAVALGARVTATAAAHDAAFVTGLGASRVIDYTTEAFETEVSDVDVVVDAVGGHTLERSYEVLREGGRLIALAAPPEQDRARRHDVTATFFIVRPDQSQLIKLAALVDEGTVRPIVAQTFPLSKGREAYGSGSTRRPPGRTVLIVA